MNFFKQIKTIFTKPEEQIGEVKKSINVSSFQLIVSDILDEPPSDDFIVLGDNEQELFEKQISQEGLENMYLKDFLLIGKKCQGRSLTLQQWQNIVKTNDLSIYSKKDLYFSVFKGIDFKVRKKVWEVFANTSQMKKSTTLSFEQLTNTNLLPAGQLEMINKDVVRTEAVTKYLDQLRNILVAYVNLSKRGYTQGMNLIGGILLRLLAIQNDKDLCNHSIIEQELPERVFWVLIGVMKWKSWSQLFERDLSGLTRMLQILKELMREHVPQILNLIQSLQWDLGIFAQYYITICLYNCPFELAPIILDLFLLDGEVVIHSFLIRMLVLSKDKILSFKDQSQLMKYLKMEMLNDTFQKIMKNRSNACCLEDFQINFLKTAF